MIDRISLASTMLKSIVFLLFAMVFVECRVADPEDVEIQVRRLDNYPGEQVSWATLQLMCDGTPVYVGATGSPQSRFGIHNRVKDGTLFYAHVSNMKVFEQYLLDNCLGRLNKQRNSNMPEGAGAGYVYIIQ